jgi:hypothetical protein
MLEMLESLTFRKAQIRYSPGLAVHNSMEPRVHCSRKLIKKALYWLRGRLRGGASSVLPKTRARYVLYLHEDQGLSSKAMVASREERAHNY